MRGNRVRIPSGRDYA